MTAADIYLAALREAAGIMEAPKPKQERPLGKKPKRLAGGCLLYSIAGLESFRGTTIKMPDRV